MNLSIMYGILNHLMSHEKTSAKELADIFEINQRSVYRYIEHMTLQNIPVNTQIGRGGGIYIDKKYKLERALLNLEERNFLKDVLSKNTNPIAKNIICKLELF